MTRRPISVWKQNRVACGQEMRRGRRQRELVKGRCRRQQDLGSSCLSFHKIQAPLPQKRGGSRVVKSWPPSGPVSRLGSVSLPVLWFFFSARVLVHGHKNCSAVAAADERPGGRGPSVQHGQRRQLLPSGRRGDSLLIGDFLGAARAHRRPPKRLAPGLRTPCCWWGHSRGPLSLTPGREC